MGTNTGIGIGIGIPFKNNALGGDRPYLPPELKARLIGVWDNYGKKNTDVDRNIIKNKIPNAGGDLEILNAAYEGMSGYNGYPVIFGINKTWKKVPTYNSIYNINDNKIHFTKILFTNRGLIFSFVKQNDQLYDITEIPSFKIRISGLKGDSKIRYSYIKTENAVYQSLLDLDNGIHELPKSLAPTDSISNDSWIGFTITPRIENETGFDCDITIEILPEYEGAFVTDGVNDMIISQKTLQEMGVTKDFTIVSMIHQISFRNFTSIPLTNYIRNGNTFIRNSISNIGKTGIYGYTCFNIKNVSSSASKVINNILGDKNDYIVEYKGDILSERFSVQGYIDDNSNILETSSVAHYWTFAVLGKATEDDINLIIGYFNLDRTLKADIYCNIEKQGLTNENHAEFNDKLIDYSGNGRDLQLFNIGWKGESGVGRYTEEFKNDYWLVHKDQTGIIKDGNSIKVVGKLSNYYIVYHSRLKATNGFKVKIKGIKTEIIYNYISSDKEQNISFKEDGIYDIPASEAVDSTFTLGFYFRYDDINLDWTGLTIEIIPSNKGALCLDGINDFGKVINMPIYKDYTFIVDREILSIDNTGIIASKSESAADATKHGAFIFEYLAAPDKISTWSFYKDNGQVANTDFTRGISYQSTYSYNGKDLTIGTSKDSDKLWLGTIRDNDSRFFNGAIYSLMSFPYSMSEFLIERQLKKHKLGTLYPNMVEFRPVIKSNIPYDKIDFFDETGKKRIYPGDYVEIGATIKANLYLNNFDISTITSVTSNQFESVSVNRVDKYYDLILEGIKKSPQKITMNIQLDENYVQFNPVINSNYDYYRLDFYLGAYTKLINIGDYIPKGTYLRADLYLKNDIDELVTFTFNGVNIDYKRNVVDDTAFNIGTIYNYDSPQEVNITIDEYIRFEDIVQPYPVLLRFKDENGNEVSWGGKFKVGSTITRIGSAADSNLLPNIYNIFELLLNGNQVISSKVIVEKTMAFKVKSAYIFDNNEPKCILSPRLLRIPNSSYKILGYIPDISGHGNHGKINNSAYAEGSGVNEDGSYQFDGVDDFVSIPTLSGGGKQVLMKVNWQKENSMLYDQRSNVEGDFTFSIYTANSVIAYNRMNKGNTYIDGILNTYIVGEQLQNITHNITITNNLVTSENSGSPVIGKSIGTSLFNQMALYDFMLFDEISTDDKIKELNTYIGITPKVTLPNYYWDNYGKKNIDANRGYIDEQVSLQKTGTSVNPLENFNISYEGMSGYNGYPVVFGANKTWANKAPEGTNSYICTINANKYNITQILLSNAWSYSYIKQNGELTDYNKDVESFKIKVTGLKSEISIRYSYLGSTDATVTSNIIIKSDGIYELPKSFANDGSLIDNYGWIGFGFTRISADIPDIIKDVNITIEILPEYENGLVYDGVSDFTDNKNIPIFTDFTAIIKRVDLDAKNDNSTVMFKGNKIYESNIGNGFILDYCYNSKNYVYSYGKLNQIERDDSKIIYLTPESYNGNPIIKGENEDNLGLVLGKYWKGIIYKTILYSKTISLLEINFLKNLMEKDEIIDINHPIFISNTEDESNTSQDT